MSHKNSTFVHPGYVVSGLMSKVLFSPFELRINLMLFLLPGIDHQGGNVPLPTLQSLLTVTLEMESGMDRLCCPFNAEMQLYLCLPFVSVAAFFVLLQVPPSADDQEFLTVFCTAGWMAISTWRWDLLLFLELAWVFSYKTRATQALLFMTEPLSLFMQDTLNGSSGGASSILTGAFRFSLCEPLYFHPRPSWISHVYHPLQ